MNFAKNQFLLFKTRPRRNSITHIRFLYTYRLDLSHKFLAHLIGLQFLDFADTYPYQNKAEPRFRRGVQQHQP